MPLFLGPLRPNLHRVKGLRWLGPALSSLPGLGRVLVLGAEATFRSMGVSLYGRRAIYRR
jgi:hypothetical protein